MRKPKPGLNVAEYAALAILRERPMHGYQIARCFADESALGLVLPIDMSAVYAILKELHEQGLIEGRRETVGARPTRTVYHLSRDTDALIEGWLEEPVARLREVRLDLLVKLFFCRRIGAHCTALLLNAQIAASRSYLERMVRLRSDLAPGSFEQLVIDSKVGPARATVEWLIEERGKLAG